VTARELARLEKQRKLAKTLRLKADAEANGEDLERRKAWEWSIEQNERWEKKQAASRERSDHTLNRKLSVVHKLISDANDEAHRKYEKDVRTSKPDLVGYARQKEAAMGLEPGSLVPLGTTNEMAAAGPSRNAALSAAEDLYRSADTLSYGDSKPSEEAVDRVVGKINKEWVLACQLRDRLWRKLTPVSLALGASARSRTTTATSRTSTRRTRCSTRRLQSTLTSTPATSAPTSSAGRRCKPRAVTTVMIECIVYLAQVCSSVPSQSSD
jgi:pre-mRNA-splicing factor SYF2